MPGKLREGLLLGPLSKTPAEALWNTLPSLIDRDCMSWHTQSSRSRNQAGCRGWRKGHNWPYHTSLCRSRRSTSSGEVSCHHHIDHTSWHIPFSRCLGRAGYRGWRKVRNLPYHMNLCTSRRPTSSGEETFSEEVPSSGEVWCRHHRDHTSWHIRFSRSRSQAGYKDWRKARNWLCHTSPCTNYRRHPTTSAWAAGWGRAARSSFAKARPVGSSGRCPVRNTGNSPHCSTVVLGCFSSRPLCHRSRQSGQSGVWPRGQWSVSGLILSSDQSTCTSTHNTGLLGRCRSSCSFRCRCFRRQAQKSPHNPCLVRALCATHKPQSRLGKRW